MKNEMGGEFRSYRGKGGVHTGFGGETEGRDHLKDLGIDGKIILK